MASYAVFDDSSSVPSSSSRFHQAAENEGEDSDCLRVETKISDLNQQCQGLGHEVSRLSIENVENDEILASLKRRIEEFNQSESRLSCEIEQLERKILMLMLEKGLKDGKLEKFGVENEFEDTKQSKLEQKFLNLMLEIENKSEKFEDFEKGEIFRELENDLAPRQLDEFEKMGNVNDEVDWSDDGVHNEIKEVNVSDNDGEEEEEEEEGIGEIGARELFKEIELLEVMLERGSSGLLDVKMMMEEVEALKGPEKMMNEMDVKMEELESGLWELKSAVEELKGKKSKELMCLVTKEIEEELQRDRKEEMNTRKLNWGSVMASVGAVVIAAAAAMVFRGRTRVKVAADRKNKQKTG